MSPPSSFLVKLQYCCLHSVDIFKFSKFSMFASFVDVPNFNVPFENITSGPLQALLPTAGRDSCAHFLRTLFAFHHCWFALLSRVVQRKLCHVRCSAQTLPCALFNANFAMCVAQCKLCHVRFSMQNLLRADTHPASREPSRHKHLGEPEGLTIGQASTFNALPHR